MDLLVTLLGANLSGSLGPLSTGPRFSGKEQLLDASASDAGANKCENGTDAPAFENAGTIPLNGV